MKGYYWRIFIAWLLLQFASRVMKDAERLLHHTFAEKAEDATTD